MHFTMPKRLLLPLIASALMTACVTNPVAEPDPQPVQYTEPAFEWPLVREELMAELRKNAHLSVQELNGGILYVQIRSADSFATGKAEMNPVLQETLEHIASVVIGHDDHLDIHVVGHTDNVGRAQANQALSEARALAVMEYLGGLGVREDKLTYEGKGQTEPLASNATREGRAVNRRVEVVITPSE